MKRLSLVERPNTVAADMRRLVLAAVPELEELLERQRGELVDVLRAIPGPRRSLMKACRSGAIAGACRVGRRWLAPRVSVEGWLRRMGPRAVAVPDEGDALEGLRARLARSVRRQSA